MREPLDDLNAIRAALSVQRRGYIAALADRIAGAKDLHRMGTMSSALEDARSCQESIEMLDRMIADERLIKNNLRYPAAAE